MAHRAVLEAVGEGGHLAMVALTVLAAAAMGAAMAVLVAPPRAAMAVRFGRLVAPEQAATVGEAAQPRTLLAMSQAMGKAQQLRRAQAKQPLAPDLALVGQTVAECRPKMGNQEGHTEAPIQHCAAPTRVEASVHLGSGHPQWLAGSKFGGEGIAKGPIRQFRCRRMPWTVAFGPEKTVGPSLIDLIRL
jgi:hypothetical protein